MRIAILTAALAAAALAPAAASAAGASPVRTASEAQTHRIAVEIRQPRWSCFGALLQRRGPFGALRLLPGGGCPELPYAILVREDPRSGWQELRRFETRAGACRARPRGLPAATRRALLGCAA
ncbi:hypothetical protein Q5424_09220, partial [Conexibacter sp. JD483]|uniref:hypothetical protein n=2 Tax=Conexibacter TaxID=191494 RepID=UPI00286FFEC5